MGDALQVLAAPATAKALEKRNFSILFTEIGDELHEFLYTEYVGADAAKDNAMNQADPFSLRWWKNTDASRDPLPGADGIRPMMDKVCPAGDAGKKGD